eukprot:TRINITY_DN11103_c0_g1_i2.p1 TRINITY_DN11103_c0_g1~~TRINITY_DN11103_c0_g1_i2.p1  ORF type:complete len:742 (+),score=165.74 TRINITY_DN11103_c0_g1_i2:102-2327(+)
MASLVPLLILCASAAALPSGFTKTNVWSVKQVMRIRFLDSNRMLLAQRDGTISIADPNDQPLDPVPYMTIPDVDESWERGLMSIALDAQFATNKYFYAFYTDSSDGVNYISRFEHQEKQGGLTSRGKLNSEVRLWTSQPVTMRFHYGGDLSIGPDETIYLTLGDAEDPFSSMADSSDNGKVIRIDRNGNFPSDNYGQGKPGALNSIWATGLRNGFRSTWDLVTNRYLISIVGGNDWDTAWESVFIAKPGSNLGWNVCEGPCDDPLGNWSQCSCAIHDDPAYTYYHNGDPGCIIGGFVNHNKRLPSEYDGVFFIGDYSLNWIKYLKFNSAGTKVISEHMFDDNIQAPLSFEQAPNGDFFITTLWAVYAVRYSGSGNTPPTITSFTGDNLKSSSVPHTVNFNVQATDADGDSLSYSWNFGDGSSSSQQSPSKTYTSKGSYPVTVTVNDGTTSSLSTTLLVELGKAPEVIIKLKDDEPFRAGKKITFQCRGFVDGVKLPHSQHDWEIVMLHEQHLHPAKSKNGKRNVKLRAPRTGHGFSTDVRYEGTCTVTDDGVSVSKTILAYPEECVMTINSQPQGINIAYDGVFGLTPYDVDQAYRFKSTLTAPEEACVGGTKYKFSEWAEGEQDTELEIRVPKEPTASFTALYLEDPDGKCASASASEGGKSCQGLCAGGFNPNDTCQCDYPFCIEYNDCCDDFNDWCLPEDRRRSVSRGHRLQRPVHLRNISASFRGYGHSYPHGFLPL